MLAFMAQLMFYIFQQPLLLWAKQLDLVYVLYMLWATQLNLVLYIKASSHVTMPSGE